MQKQATAFLRVVRAMKFGFIVSGLLLSFVALKIPAPPRRAANDVFQLVLFILALTSIVVGFFVPGFLTRVRPFQNRPGSTARDQWMSRSVFSLACFDACLLFGLVLHLIRARASFVEIALAAGMISLLIWKPQPPPTSDMAGDIAAKTPPIDNSSIFGAHMYRVSTPNRVFLEVLCAALLCVFPFFLHHQLQIRPGLHAAAAVKDDLILFLPLLGLTLFMAIRSRQMRITITGSQVEVVNPFRTYTVPFDEISGRRLAGRGMYLCRRGKPSISVNESLYRLDDFYWQWRASIYDRDKADRLKRKAAGKKRWTDSSFDEEPQTHPAIGGPDADIVA